MPRRRDPSKQVSRRSHRGCHRCRLHKIRCDEAKPQCGPCTSRGYTDCVYAQILKWETDYVGRAFGRAGVWSKSGAAAGTKKKAASTAPPSTLHNYKSLPTRIHSFGFLNSYITDFAREDNTPSSSSSDDSSNDSRKSTAIVLRKNLVTVNRPVTYIKLDSETESHLLSYYLEKICPMTVPCAKNESPFSTLIYPFAVSSSSPALTHALLGLAASHRARSDVKYQPIALSYSAKVIRSLRLTLHHKSSIDIAASSEILVLMMLLCQLEIIAECDKRWVTHLRGARDLIRFRRQGMTSDAAKVAARQQSPWEQIIKFTERYFAFYDVMGRTACGEEPIFGNDFWSAQEDQLDLWMGCSPKLVSIIGEVTELSFKYHRLPSSPAENVWQDLEQQRMRLTTLLQQPQLKSDSEDEVIRTSVELKRLTVELYLHSALNDTTPASPVIRQSVKKILRLISQLLMVDVKAGLTWPLFMAACQLEPTEELEYAAGDAEDDEVPRYARPFVLYALEKLSDSLSNVTRARSVIEKVWKQREAALFLTTDRPLTPSPKGFNDWSRFVAPLCHNISLA
ncbi:putative transcriptional regulatory protein C965.10-like protein 1 [Colletotrichum chlorophyti]|uniref:Putative transcriptional regulatory protein C965.10-like protein 1 n=1 Tax=Colletotrichum chlorophyti TaxID=708187 RepID=A0A1Q8RT30_9PEZI|nr:putative transcriptional regulatory protein C965.10-like protein 1 [Colletotrichum chlorophyti]